MMREGMTASAVLHVALLLVLIFGVPNMARELPEYRPPVPVDIVDISELTNLSIEDSPVPADKTPPKPVAAAPKPIQQETPKAVSAPASKPPPPPEPVTSEPIKEVPPEPAQPDPVIAKEEPAAETVPDVVPDAMPEKKVEPPKPAPVPIAKPKPPAPPKTDVAVKKPDEPSKADDFLQSVLKNVAAAPDQKAERQAKVVQDAPPAPMSASNNTGRRGDRLTISEQDALRRHVSQFWSPPVGARGAETMVVVVSIEMNPDRTVRTAQVTDASRASSDPFYRSAAESAVRAVLRASPLTPLPPDKFDEWRTIKITFDPREMM
jgi:TonB family protein